MVNSQTVLTCCCFFCGAKKSSSLALSRLNLPTMQQHGEIKAWNQSELGLAGFDCSLITFCNEYFCWTWLLHWWDNVCLFDGNIKNIHPSPFLMSSGGTFNQAFRVLKISFLSPWNKETQGISIRPLIDCKLTVWVTSQSFQFSLTLLFSTWCVQWVITYVTVAGSVEGKSNNLILRPRTRPMSSQDVWMRTFILW